MSKRQVAVIVPVVIAFSFLFGWQAGRTNVLSPPSSSPSSSSSPSAVSQRTSGAFDSAARTRQTDLSLFWEVWDRIREQYVDPSAIDAKRLTYGAIRGMVDAVEDPYTVFMDPDESTEFKNNLSGTLEGIGAQLSVQEKNLVVMSVLKGSPAEKANLKSGDVILKVNEELASDMTLYEAITKIRGKKGTTVKLLMFRKNNGDPFEVAITRDEIHLDSVTFEEKKKGVFYVGLHQFTDTTMMELNDAIAKIALKEPRGVVLDLRNNGGGLLEVAVDVLSEFVPGQQDVVVIRKRDPKDDEKRTTSGSGRLASVPLVVLVNGSSASASEIVAGAIQDLKRGTVMGEKTFGKGSVQDVEWLGDNSSLRVTIAKWLTPLGRSIDKEGIVPDTVLKLSEKDAERMAQKNFDPQLDAAVKSFR